MIEGFERTPYGVIYALDLLLHTLETIDFTILTMLTRIVMNEHCNNLIIAYFFELRR